MIEKEEENTDAHCCGKSLSLKNILENIYPNINGERTGKISLPSSTDVRQQMWAKFRKNKLKKRAQCIDYF